MALEKCEIFCGNFPIASCDHQNIPDFQAVEVRSEEFVNPVAEVVTKLQCHRRVMLLKDCLHADAGINNQFHEIDGDKGQRRRVRPALRKFVRGLLLHVPRCEHRHQRAQYGQSGKHP